MKLHKDPIATIVGLRERMETLNINHTQLAGLLDLAVEHVRKVTAGSCGLSIQVLCRLAKTFGPMQFEFEGERWEIRRPSDETRTLHDIIMSLAEAGWVAKEENDEAEMLIPRMLDAAHKKDFETLVYLYEQVFCDPRHSSQLLEIAFARSVGDTYYQIRRRAEEHHWQKVAEKVA